MDLLGILNMCLNFHEIPKEYQISDNITNSFFRKTQLKNNRIKHASTYNLSQIVE